MLAVVILAVGANRVAADGDPPRIGLDPVRVAAGGSLTVHGIDFADAGPVSIVLVDGGGGTTPIGSATADDHGGFMTAVAIPVGTVPGAFLIRAIPVDGEPVEGAVSVGPPIPVPGEQRGAEEPLLAPMPSAVAPAVEAPVVVASQAPTSAVATTAPPEPLTLGAVGAGLALLVLVVGGVAWRRSRDIDR